MTEADRVREERKSHNFPWQLNKDGLPIGLIYYFPCSKPKKGEIASGAVIRSVLDFALSPKKNRCDLDNETVIRRSEWANLNQRWPRGFLVSIDLINSFVVGISGGEILSARKPISSSVGTTSSRPAISPQIVTGFPEASAMMMPSNRSIDG